MPKVDTRAAAFAAVFLTRIAMMSGKSASVEDCAEADADPDPDPPAAAAAQAPLAEADEPEFASGMAESVVVNARLVVAAESLDAIVSLCRSLSLRGSALVTADNLSTRVNLWGVGLTLQACFQMPPS